MNPNLRWAKTLIEQLLAQGVDYFCLAPGFRSTPLTIAIGEKYQANSFVHFDERGLGFHALGYAKATGKPAVVIVTSGTAVGNLMPAVMEASHSHVPLILLTSDRPHDLRDTMANQTTDQVKIFGDFVRYFIDLPIPQDGLAANFLATTVGQAVAKASDGPIQMNCPFFEPFFDHQPSKAFETTATEYVFGALEIEDEDAQKWASQLQKVEKGVILLGGNANCPSATRLAKKLGWPIFADIISNSRERPHEMSIPYYHHILKSNPQLKADLVVHFGDLFVSKVLLQWLKGPILHVASHTKRCDPTHQVTTRIVSHPEAFCQKVVSYLKPKCINWFDEWKELSNAIGKALPPIFEDKQSLSEPALTKVLEEQVSSCALFFGNSMPIRDADMFFFPKSHCGPIFANRGLSGIDGNIATIAGIAMTKSVIGVIGDQTFLHDLNSLTMLTKTNYPVKIIVINNGGGGIFSFVAIKEKKDLLDPYFAAAHHLTFEKGAALFGLSYASIETKEDLEKHLLAKGSTILEVFTNRDENYKLHQKIDETIQVCTSSSTVF